MYRPNRSLVSAMALAVALAAPAFAQAPFADAESPEELPQGLRDQLPQLAEACEADDALELPAGLTCAQVLRFVEITEEDGTRAESPEAPTAPMAAPTDEADAPAVEAPAETAPVEVEKAPPAATPDATRTEEAEAPAVKAPARAEAASEQENREQEVLQAREAQEDPAPADSQAQADALAQQEQAVSDAIAAMTGGTGSDAEMIEETVTEDAVRSSSEDFDTQVGEQIEESRQRSSAGNDDDDGDDNRLRNAALLGLGAIALSQILDGDDRVVSNSGDRVVIEQDGQLRVLRNEDVLLRRPGAEVQTYRYEDGSTRSVVTYDDGTQVETIRAMDGRALRRTRIFADGREVVLFDDTLQSAAVEVNELPQVGDRRSVQFEQVNAENLAAALSAQEVQGLSRSFSLNQIRNIDRVRQLVPEISVGTINFQTASAAIRPEEAQELSELGNAMRRMIEDNPGEVFLIEGHTDAVGNAAYNLALSDRRAESVALALTEYFQVPPENMVLQGYGEGDLLIPTVDAERANRRAAVRRITPLLQSASR